MQYLFLSPEHWKGFDCLMHNDQTSWDDKERISLFYIIAGSDDLYSKHSYIYDFKEHAIKLCIDSGEVDFSSGMRALIRLGFNLYNGYRDSYSTPIDIFCNLDSNNLLLAHNAVRIRFR